MEDGRKEEAPANHTRWLTNHLPNAQPGGKPYPLYYPQFIWLAPCKDREARVEMLKRCAIATTVGHVETSPEVAEGVLREVYSFEYPWKAVPVGNKTYLIEFPSISILEKASTGGILFGSKNALVVKKWEENIGATGVLQKFWIQLRGLPRECWVWDDIKGVLDRFCGLEKIECGGATNDTRDFVRALVIGVGPEYLPAAVRVGINCKIHDVYIQAEIGQGISYLEVPRESSNICHVGYGNPEYTCGLVVPSVNKWKELRVKRGYVVTPDSEETGRSNQSMSFIAPYIPNSLETYSKKIGPSCLSQGGGNGWKNTTGSITECHKRVNEEYEGVKGDASGEAKRRPLELFPEDFWTSTNHGDTDSRKMNDTNK
ncbi:hypothetical protein ACP70R_023174 [Stipagrostis hirtigluma subsp. patula]